MKKFIYLLLTIGLIYNCSDDDDTSNTEVSGCTDIQATNYNANANSDDGTCLYSIVGDWTVTEYTLSDGTDILAAYDYIDYTLYSDNSFIQSFRVTGTTDELIVTGTYSIGGSNNSSITYIVDGSATVATILSVSYTNMSLNFDVDSTTTAYMELVRI
tara:strand:+ start:193 stop:666 length:474 start_codon:yes stop_codon:yes gene_type:complete